MKLHNAKYRIKPIEESIAEGECIVYLEVLKKAETGVYDAYVDFRLLKDIALFRQASEENLNFGNQNTYLHLTSFKSNKRLIRGCYYALNLSLLLSFSYTIDDDSLLVARTYDLSNMETPQTEVGELLQSHHPLDPEELLAWHQNPQIHIAPISSANLCLSVRNVNQANWNELLDGNKIKLIYDLGAKLQANKMEVANLFNVRKSDIMRDKPILIISHWDMDHIHCLKYLSVQDMANSFSKVICVDKKMSCTSQRIYNDLVSAVGEANISCIQPPNKTDGITMHLWKRIGDVVFYIGEKSRNINYCGLCMYVQGQSKSVSFTGDVKLIQAKHMYNQEKNDIDAQHHILIVPHHGGDYGASSRIYSHPLTEAIISVGKGNQYGHPDEYMIRYLETLCGNIKQTCNVGDIFDNL